jgi:hypothetical protein
MSSHLAAGGRRINVERTVGGGGAKEKRTDKISQLRASQGARSHADYSTVLALTQGPRNALECSFLIWQACT